MGFARQEYWNGLPLPSPTEDIEGRKCISHLPKHTRWSRERWAGTVQKTGTQVTFTRFSLRCGGLWNSDGIYKLSSPPLSPSLSPPCSERLHPWPKGIKAQTQLVLGWGWTACGSLVLPVSSMVHVTFSILRLYFLLSPQTLPASSPLDCLSPLLNPHPGGRRTITTRPPGEDPACLFGLISAIGLLAHELPSSSWSPVSSGSWVLGHWGPYFGLHYIQGGSRGSHDQWKLVVSGTSESCSSGNLILKYGNGKRLLRLEPCSPEPWTSVHFLTWSWCFDYLFTLVSFSFLVYKMGIILTQLIPKWIVVALLKVSWAVRNVRDNYSSYYCFSFMPLCHWKTL